MLKPNFKKEYIVANLGTTPASVNLKTGDLYINEAIFYKLTPVQQNFVLWHEHGHYALKTKSEFKADEYAFKKLAAQGVSPKELVYSISDILSGGSKEHYDRLFAQYERALDYDDQNPNVVNFGGAMKAKRTAKKEERQAKRTERKNVRIARVDRRKDLKVQKKEDRLQRKNDRQENRIDRKSRRLGLRETQKETNRMRILGRQENIGNRIAGNNYKKMTLADQGVSEGDLIGGKVMDGVGGIVKGIFGKGGGDDGGDTGGYEARNAEVEQAAKNNQMMIVGAIVLVAVVFFMMQKKK